MESKESLRRIKSRIAAVASAIAFSCSIPAFAAGDVLVLSGGNATNDGQVTSALVARGYNVAIGPEAASFTGAGLAGIEAVVLLTNYNWNGNGASMPAAGQNSLVSFVNGGGGLVTSEWLIWRNFATVGSFSILSDAIPATSGASYRTAGTATYTQVTANSVLNAGLPATFDFPMTNLSGTDSRIQPKSGATVFYDSDYVGGDGVIGWGYGSGRVISFSTLIAENEMNNANYNRLFGNAVDWVAGGVSAPIPEPESYAMLLAGLGLLGFMARRRARKAA